MELAELVEDMRVVELAAKTRRGAIRELARAAKLETEGVSLDAIVEAVEEREATAQTIVAKDFALPHAVLDWNGTCRIVLGRSRTGLTYGVAQQERVHLILLLLVGRNQSQLHVDVLAALAGLFEPEAFRDAIAQARDREAIKRLLAERVGLEAVQRARRLPGLPRINTLLIRHAIQLMEAVEAQALLVAVDRLESVPWQTLSDWPGRLIVVTARHREEPPVERPDTHVFDAPQAYLSRMDRANLGMLLAASAGLLPRQASVVCVTGPAGRELDSVTVASPDAQLRDMFDSKAGRRGGIRPPVILRVLSLAIELAAEGREAKPVGAMFVIGDTRHVMRHAHQLVLNPFHGFSRPLRNILDPSLAETIKEFSMIDGAFIIQGDGMVRTAGAYLVPRAAATRLPKGLGARHQAAAAITAQTRAMAITVSQSTGAVTVFRNGAIVFTLGRSAGPG